MTRRERRRACNALAASVFSEEYAEIDAMVLATVESMARGGPVRGSAIVRHHSDGYASAASTFEDSLRRLLAAGRIVLGPDGFAVCR